MRSMQLRRRAAARSSAAPATGQALVPAYAACIRHSVTALRGAQQTNVRSAAKRAAQRENQNQNAPHAAIKYKAKEKPGLDWWGVNYYARGAITGWCLPAHAPGELMTDMKARFMLAVQPLARACAAPAASSQCHGGGAVALAAGCAWSRAWTQPLGHCCAVCGPRMRRSAAAIRASTPVGFEIPACAATASIQAGTPFATHAVPPHQYKRALRPQHMRCCALHDVPAEPVREHRARQRAGRADVRDGDRLRGPQRRRPPPHLQHRVLHEPGAPIFVVRPFLL